VLVGAPGERLHHLPVVGQVDQQELAVHVAWVAATGAVHRQHVDAHGAQVGDHGTAELAGGTGDDDTPGQCGFAHDHIFAGGKRGPARGYALPLA
jgi:hypothetical protein